MLVDISGTVLIPGNGGKDCPGNGSVPGVECCCNECDYFLCCFDIDYEKSCASCKDLDCPRKAEQLPMLNTE